MDKLTMVQIREATENDVDAIREIYFATYGSDYAYPQFYEPALLKKLIFSDDTAMLVAEDPETGKVLGTASVVLDVGGFSDLIGEFGRLAVHPDARRRGVGTALMTARLEYVSDRIHVGIAGTRAGHSHAQKISAAHGFQAVGVLPMKLKLVERESVVFWVRYFGDSLALRCNNPRIIPEAYPLAQLALGNCDLPVDPIVDEKSAPYSQQDHFELEEFTTQGYSRLLRFERGRVQNREIFGPVRLHYGMFRLLARHSNYLLAREGGRIVGAVGYMVDRVEKEVRIFELISTTDAPIRFLLRALERRCQNVEEIDYFEVDVSAFAPRMQRTLLELGFLPAAYIPAMVFHDVERLDVIKMVRLTVPLEMDRTILIPQVEPLGNIVCQGFLTRRALPEIASVVHRMRLFAGLNGEQVGRLAGACETASFAAGEKMFRQNDPDNRLFLILNGEVTIRHGPEDKEVGSVGAGECLGEKSLLSTAAHSASAVAKTDVDVAVLDHDDLRELIRRRPDIGVAIYRNLASGLAEKLKRSDDSISGG